ncbi:S-adenosyl-L-methionine-dependent methyltransferase [Lophiostoma macrostomum CBS 122681]|uniref:S-adenosyl-L-methionine-dependent methyltransferase n=1 Tax=Lophiostoma macrostomum CBS 122681 TaxID=1314788 RepID=A0A6A6T4T6_9PLEO|nr:S-adenosyl-L-methionine-dependent methyltransferase [Lophiostoma macrostomum CBS 122681]
MSFSTIIQTIRDATANSGTATSAEKAQLVEACNGLVTALETPEQKLTSLCFGPVRALIIRLGIDIHLFDVATAALKKGESLNMQQLSDETKCEALLIRRLIRVLIDMNHFREVDQDVFQPLPEVALFSTTSPISQAMIQFTNTLQHMFQLPAYFEARGYQSPTDAFDGPFQFVTGTKLHVFEWLASNPRYQHANDVTMSLRTKLASQEKWFDIYPLEQHLAATPPSETFLVDVGGGVGHHSIALKERYTQLPGKIVVQDIAPVIDGISSMPEGIEAMTHDFFEPQPCRNAKIYFVGHILHDWPDKQAKTILENIRNAMAPESVLLLDEPLLPERDVTFLPAVMDLVMMSQFSSLERTEHQFRELLDSVGLELVKVWESSNTMSGQSIIEVRRRR